MNALSGKKILLGISGGIAAYKIPLLVRQFIQNGAEVRVVMTPDAKEFVTPLTLATLSKNEVLSTFTTTDTDNPNWNDHVAMALWADVFLIAPATANTISSMAHARCNNLLLAVYLSAKCPVFIAPAMDLDMYAHPATQKNLEALSRFGHHVLPVGTGFLASGLSGKGRMLEPEEILIHLMEYFSPELPLAGTTVLITAGPTYEAIDPVRFIGNHSSGKMGFALAETAANKGAKVYLVCGPNVLKTQNPNIERFDVTTAAEMFEQVKQLYPNVDYAIAAAAVADYRPQNVQNQKIKKKEQALVIDLEPTIDILAYMGKHKKNQQLIGFALETENGMVHAQDKLKRKNLDGIVLNTLADEGAGFSTDTNKITYIDKDLKATSFALKSKAEVAEDIFNQILAPHA